jgi:hypothetical protein
VTDQARHWTYHEETLVKGDLEQGDILRPTEMLKKIFGKVHPHFVNPKYFGFMIITQSCDLVRRDGKPCGARYINVAAIRLLDHVLLHLLDSVCASVISGVYEEETKGQATSLIRRLINQNEQGLGLFYLHSDPAIGINEPAVAMLRITVALKAEHYETLEQSRMGRLAQEFRPKLGWLVGNLYSRVGTQDWSDPAERRDKIDELVERILTPPSKDNQPIWIQKKQIKAAEKGGIKIGDLNRDNIVDQLAKYKPQSKKEVAATVSKEVLQKLLLDPGWLVNKFSYRLRSDPKFADSVEPIAEILKTLLSEDPKLADQFFNRLLNASTFSDLFK